MKQTESEIIPLQIAGHCKAVIHPMEELKEVLKVKDILIMLLRYYLPFYYVKGYLKYFLFHIYKNCFPILYP